MSLMLNTHLVASQHVLVHEGFTYKVVHVYNCHYPLYIDRELVTGTSMKYATYCLPQQHWNLLVPNYDYMAVLHLCRLFHHF